MPSYNLTFDNLPQVLSSAASKLRAMDETYIVRTEGRLKENPSMVRHIVCKSLMHIRTMVSNPSFRAHKALISQSIQETYNAESKELEDYSTQAEKNARRAPDLLNFATVMGYIGMNVPSLNQDCQLIMEYFQALSENGYARRTQFYFREPLTGNKMWAFGFDNETSLKSSIVEDGMFETVKKLRKIVIDEALSKLSEDLEPAKANDLKKKMDLWLLDKGLI